MAEHLVDTNIFITIFKGDAKLKNFVESIGSLIDSIVYLELIQGAKNKAEVEKIEKYLTRFQLLHFLSRLSKTNLLLRKVRKQFQKFC